MMNLETIESLQAYADRLHRDAALLRQVPTRHRPGLRALLRTSATGRRTA